MGQIGGMLPKTIWWSGEWKNGLPDGQETMGAGPSQNPPLLLVNGTELHCPPLIIIKCEGQPSISKSVGEEQIPMDKGSNFVGF